MSRLSYHLISSTNFWNSFWMNWEVWLVSNYTLICQRMWDVLMTPNLYHSFLTNWNNLPKNCKTQAKNGEWKLLLLICKIMAQSDDQVTINNNAVENVEHFVFLGSVVPQKIGWCEEENSLCFRQIEQDLINMMQISQVIQGLERLVHRESTNR